MKTFTLTLCFIGAAALVAGLVGPAAQADVSDPTPAVSVDAPSPPVCTMPAEPDVEEKATCMLCGSGSTGACKGAQQCRGSRKACRAKGCKISGTASCSTAANVKKC
jgi:hypothetical protein